MKSFVKNGLIKLSIALILFLIMWVLDLKIGTHFWREMPTISHYVLMGSILFWILGIDCRPIIWICELLPIIILFTLVSLFEIRIIDILYMVYGILFAIFTIYQLFNFIRMYSYLKKMKAFCFMISNQCFDELSWKIKRYIHIKQFMGKLHGLEDTNQERIELHDDFTEKKCLFFEDDIIDALDLIDINELSHISLASRNNIEMKNCSEAYESILNLLSSDNADIQGKSNIEEIKNYVEHKLGWLNFKISYEVNKLYYTYIVFTCLIEMRLAELETDFGIFNEIVEKLDEAEEFEDLQKELMRSLYIALLYHENDTWLDEIIINLMEKDTNGYFEGII